ncbi:MAG: hypothetical protein RMK19_05575 [Bacteroidia bacterium]|nr:hypothetical protein [Bacteroidia bacterium]MDW8015464.1 hypothetical protein [Bacteroidia bacterium]
MKKNQGILLFLLVVTGAACRREKKDADEDLGHAAVTTVEVVLIQGTDTLRCRYKDPDGPGGRPPAVDTLRPAPNEEYTYFVRVLDESGMPTQDLTEVIFTQQKNTHRLFFFPEPAELASIEPTDTDDLGRPVGGRGIWRQGSPLISEGAVRLVLRHYLNSGEKNFGLERGSTDLDANLPVRIRR